MLQGKYISEFRIIFDLNVKSTIPIYPIVEMGRVLRQPAKRCFGFRRHCKVIRGKMRHKTSFQRIKK